MQTSTYNIDVSEIAIELACCNVAFTVALHLDMAGFFIDGCKAFPYYNFQILLQLVSTSVIYIFSFM